MSRSMASSSASLAFASSNSFALRSSFSFLCFSTLPKYKIEYMVSTAHSSFKIAQKTKKEKRGDTWHPLHYNHNFPLQESGKEARGKRDEGEEGIERGHRAAEKDDIKTDTPCIHIDVYIYIFLIDLT